MGYGTLIQRITYKISGRSATSSGLYTPSTNQYDYALGGIPFLSATGDSRPDIEKPVPQRKQQFDNYKDPGEYSLDQWWLRSQSSYVGGAGIVYQDPDTQGTEKNVRFARSIGINPFDNPSQFSLLKETEKAADPTSANLGTAYVTPVTVGGTDMIFLGKGDKFEIRSVTASDLPVSSTGTVPTSGATQSLQGGIVAFVDSTGVSFLNPQCFGFMQDFSSAANSGIWRFSSSGGAPTKIYAAPTNINSVTVSKAKGLIAFGAQNNLYMLDPYAAPASPLPAANAAVPRDQTIVAISDGPDAVYVAANSSTRGYIYKTTFNNLGVVNGLSVAAVLPEGEMINDCQVYINTYIVISSTIGIRVGTFTATGIAYGPLLIQVAEDSVSIGQGFGRIAFYGTHAYICTIGVAQHDGYKGLMCVDLGSLNQDQNTGQTFNAYCTWNYYPGNVDQLTDVCVTGAGRPVFTSGFNAAAFVYVEHETTLISQGYLETGRCRFNTQEPKLFKYVSIRTPADLQGDLTVTLLDDSGGQTNYITYGPTLTPGTEDIATPTPQGPRNYESFRFTLRRNPSTVSLGAIMNSWQIKALPGTLKQRIIQRNFLCFNGEEDKGGQRIFGDTMSLDRLIAVRQMCQRGDTVTFQDLANNLATQVIIDDYQFTMLAPPGPNKENYGGYLTVTMRTVADAVPNTTPVMVEGD